MRCKSKAVVALLEQLTSLYPAPAFFRSDNGPEFIAHALKRWSDNSGTTTAYIEPGSPWQNGFTESFNSRFRDEFLNTERFATVAEAKALADRWRWEYNNLRPHSALQGLTPLEAANLIAPGPMNGVTSAVLGILSCCRSSPDLEAFAMRHREALNHSLELDFKRWPSDATFLYLFNKAHLQELREALQAWMISHSPGGAER